MRRVWVLRRLGRPWGSIASNDGYAGVSLEVDGEGARNCTVLGYTGWGRGCRVNVLWGTPGRGCWVRLVLNVGFWAIKLAEGVR